jgi:glycosyltransferase involved in cell wall biosynthesis
MTTCSRVADISAILPNYNMAELLPAALDSLLAQTKPFTEIIIVDDGSTDNSLAVIQPYLDQHPSVRLLKHAENQGVLTALNTGIEHARGDYLMLCAADDTYTNIIVEKTQPVIKRYPNVGVICGDAMVERYDLQSPFYRRLPFQPERFISADEFKSMARKSYVGFNGGGGMLINRKVVIAAGMLQLNSRWHGDWILYFAAAFRNGVYYINHVFTHINMRKDGYSEGKKHKTAQDNVMLATVDIIKNRYPELWNDFRDSALLPHYTLRYISLFLSDPIARQFVTRKLIWKLMINNTMMIRIGRIFPYHVILGMRKFLKA